MNPSSKTQILITGPTGNIGREVVRYLQEGYPELASIAAVRDLESSKELLNRYPQVQLRKFDFEDINSFSHAFNGIDILFLLRPPHISDVKKVFVPLLDSACDSGIRRIVFLSVQGVEKRSIIPHHKIEAYIRKRGFDFIFVRPSYFMQNLTKTLAKEIQNEDRVSLPSGNALFNWVDAANVGEAAAALIHDFEVHRNKAFDITGNENLSFPVVLERMSKILGRNIDFNALDPIRFFWKKKQEGVETGLVLVMTMLHFLPRLQAPPMISSNYEMLSGKQPTTIESFITTNQTAFIKA